MPRFLGTLLPLVLLTTCGEPAPEREWTPADHGQPQSVDPQRDPQSGGGAIETSPEAAEARAARALWNVSCARCHGRDGQGQGPERPPGAQMPNLRDPAFQQSRSDTQLAAVISQGGELMPAFGEEINPAGIRALVKHVRSLSGAAAAPAATP